MLVVPAIGSSKNDGVEGGVIVPILFGDADGRISQMVVPMFIRNQYVGSRATLNLFQYPHRGEDINVVGSYTEKIERKLIGTYRNLYIADGRFSLEARGGFFKNATARFFGIGANSVEANETNYTDRELFATATAGIYIGPGTRVTETERVRNVEVQRGALPTLPFTQEAFPSVRGTGGGTVLGHRLALLRDTRDDAVTPTIGSFFATFAELAHYLTKDSTTAFSRYGIEYRKLLPNATKRYTFAFRAKLEATVGGADIPFYERSSLGGQNSLRGFGEGRFIDNHAILFSFEERVQLFHLRVLGTITEVETAPFLDVGKVTDTFAYRAFSQYEFNPGLGFRAIARPNVVGRLDVGTGSEGKAVFAGLDFPF